MYKPESAITVQENSANVTMIEYLVEIMISVMVIVIFMKVASSAMKDDRKLPQRFHVDPPPPSRPVRVFKTKEVELDVAIPTPKGIEAIENIEKYSPDWVIHETQLSESQVGLLRVLVTVGKLEESDPHMEDTSVKLDLKTLENLGYAKVIWRTGWYYGDTAQMVDNSMRYCTEHGCTDLNVVFGNVISRMNRGG